MAFHERGRRIHIDKSELKKAKIVEESRSSEMQQDKCKITVLRIM